MLEAARTGSETQRPLAIAVIGGLVTATLHMLVVLPVLCVAWFPGKNLGEEAQAFSPRRRRWAKARA